nr:hypothetical protein CPGR_04170 [Mycolicibacterium malmesburyense]
MLVRNRFHSRCFRSFGFAIAIDAHGPTFSSFGITSRSAASRSGSLAPITVRRITSRVISDIFGATGNGLPTGHPAMFSAAISAITPACRATASRWNGAIISRRRSRCTSSSTTSTELSPSSPPSIEFASPAW